MFRIGNDLEKTVKLPSITRLFNQVPQHAFDEQNKQDPIKNNADLRLATDEKKYLRDMADNRANQQYFEGPKLPQISSLMQENLLASHTNQKRLQNYSDVIETPDLIKHGYQILNQ